MERFIPFTADDPHRAIALFGGAYSDLIDTERTGFLPPTVNYQDLLSYQKKIRANGLHLYYALPILATIEHEDALLAKNIQTRFQTKQQAQFELSYENALRTAIGYAREASVRRPFQKMFKGQLGNIDVETILALSFQFSSIFTYQRLFEFAELFDFDEGDGDVRQIAEIRKLLPERKIVSMLDSILNKRGVLFFFGKSLLEHDLRLGLEDDAELLITPRKKLPKSVLIGVSPLSDNDIPPKLAANLSERSVF